MSREERNVIGYMVGLISEFANHYGIYPRQAYAYLKRFKGIEHLREHYGVLHTQSFADRQRLWRRFAVTMEDSCDDTTLPWLEHED